MKKDFNRIGATLCSSMRPRSSTTSWLNKFKLLALVLMTLLSVNQVWGADETVTWSVSTSTANTITKDSGTLPTGASASMTSDDNQQDKSQLTSGKKQTFTLTGMDGCTITGISLNMKKSSKGSTATVKVEVGNTTLQSGASITLGTAASNYAISLDNKTTVVGAGKNVVITVTSNKNSAYVLKYIVTYSAAAPANPYTVFFNAGSGTCTSSLTEAPAGAGVTLPTPTISCGDWTFAGWKETSAQTETTTAPTLLAAGSNYKPSSNNCTLYAVYSKTESGGTSQRETTLDMSDLLGKTITEENTLNGFTLQFAANGGTAPVINATAEDARLYAKGTLSISSDATMTAISFIISTQGKKRLATISSSTGSMTISGADAYECSWSGSAKAVTFTVGSSADYGSDGSSKAGQLDFDDIVISYSGGSTTTYYSNPECISTYTLLFSELKLPNFYGIF